MSAYVQEYQQVASYQEVANWIIRKAFMDEQGALVLKLLARFSPSQESSAEMIADIGEEAISKQGPEFIAANIGRFVAVSLASDKILAMADTMEQLNQELVKKKIKENCYVKKLGSSTVAEIR
jgi:hypothetical protein